MSILDPLKTSLPTSSHKASDITRTGEVNTQNVAEKAYNNLANKVKTLKEANIFKEITQAGISVYVDYGNQHSQPKLIMGISDGKRLAGAYIPQSMITDTALSLKELVHQLVHVKLGYISNTTAAQEKDSIQKSIPYLEDILTKLPEGAFKKDFDKIIKEEKKKLSTTK